MGTRVVVNLGEGTCQTGLPNVVVQLLQPSQQMTDAKFQLNGQLSPAPSLEAMYKDWRSLYSALYSRLNRSCRMFEFNAETPTNVSIREFEVLGRRLQEELNRWLSGIAKIEMQIRSYLSLDEQVRIIVETDDPVLQALPWHLWSFFEDHPNAEVAISKREHKLAQPSVSTFPQRVSDSVRVLAVLGCSNNIDVQKDRGLLERVPHAEVVLLEEPSRAEFDQQLWDEAGWDVLFFAGHSTYQSSDLSGQLVINSTERITIAQLKSALRRAIAKGLKLAIFNSCDGLGLGRDLADLNIPQLIVMREPIADQVAQAFLKQFLKVFSTGHPFYVSVRHAREQLQGLEGEFPGASWLPVIFQNPAEVPMQWPKEPLMDVSSQANNQRQGEEFQGTRTDSPASVFPKLRPSQPKSIRQRVLWSTCISVAATAAVMGVRLLGVLQPFELAAYDHLMRSRPKTLETPIDPHLLVIEVTEEDTKKYGYPLDDDLLARAIARVQQHNPKVLGIDMHRSQPRGSGREELMNQFRQHPNLFTVCSFDRGDRPIYAPPREFSPEQQRNQVGFSDIETDGNEDSRYPVARRQLLTYDPTVTPDVSLCTTPFSFSFHLTYAFLDAKGVEPIKPVDDGWQFGDVVFRRLPNRMVGYQHLGGQSNQILLNYRFNERPGRKVTLRKVLEGTVNPNLITDRIVLMGTVDEVGFDEIDTPYGLMPGVWVHAHMVSQMVEAVVNGRSLIWALPQWGWVQWGDFLFVWAWAVLGGIVTLCIRPRWALILSGGVIILVMYYTCLFILLQGGWVPLLPSGLAVLMTFGLIGLFGLYRRPKFQRQGSSG